MYSKGQGSRPPWTLRVLVVNFALSVIVPFTFAVGHPIQMRTFGRDVACSLIYSNMIGLPAVLLLPGLVDRCARRKLPLLPVVIVSILLVTSLGGMAAGLMLVAVGLFPASLFWIEFSNTFRFTILLALAFGLGAYFYESLREQLLATTAKLREKEIEEERARKLAAEARLSSLESRIHPHFLFNTLNSISSLIPVDPEKAEVTVGRLAALLRASLDTTAHPLISLERELSIVSDYVEIEKARFGSRLRGQIQVPEELRSAQVPPLSIQSLMENAVKHGIAKQSGSGQVSVSASAENGFLRVEVSDTGTGFDLTTVQAGHGLDNLVGRLDALFGSQARLEVVQREGKCVVQMILPRYETSRISG